MIELSQHSGLATEWLPNKAGSQEELREVWRTGRRLQGGGGGGGGGLRSSSPTTHM